VFQSYIDKEWVFVAVRINVTFKGKRFDGSFRPMGFRFRSPDIIIPTRVASIYPQGMPFAIYVVSNTAVEFPTAWGRGRVTTFALSSEQLLASPAIRREMEENAVLDRSGSLKQLAKSIRAQSKEDYEAFLRRKTTGLYLSKFAGRFSREQLSRGDLVFVRDSLIDKDQVDAYVKDLRGTELKKVKIARRVLSAAGVGHIATLAAHLTSADSQLRITLSGILSMIGDLEAVPHLIEALASEKDRLTRSAIYRALRELTGHTPEGGDWKKWWERVKK